MKRIILLIHISIMIISNSFGQELIDVNKKWINSSGTLGTAGPPPYFMHSNICKFDTNGPIINNHKYAKLLYTTDSTELAWVEHGYMRETPSGQIFYISSLTDTVEKLCYDFGASVGDSLSIYYIEYNTTLPFVVDSVDSIFFAGKMRKRIMGAGEWISGIGSLSGLIDNIGGMVGYVYILNCYFENNILLYHNAQYPNSTCFYEVTGIEDINNNFNSHCIIFPNPIVDESFIKLPATIQNKPNYRFELYNLLGQCVESFLISEKHTLKKEQLFPGVFLYKISNNDNEVYSGKILVE